MGKRHPPLIPAQRPAPAPSDEDREQQNRPYFGSYGKRERDEGPGPALFRGGKQRERNEQNNHRIVVACGPEFDHRQRRPGVNQHALLRQVVRNHIAQTAT